MELTKKIEEMIFGMSRTSAAEVVVEYDPLEEFLGKSEADKYCIWIGKTQEALMRKKKNSLIPENKRIRATRMCGVTRAPLVEALKKKLTTKQKPSSPTS